MHTASPIVALLLAMFLFLGSTGCSSSGTEIRTDNLQQVQKGVTTRAEFENIMGPPDDVLFADEGGRFLMYTHTKGRAKAENFIPFVGMFRGGANLDINRLQVLVDKDGVVQDWEYTEKDMDMTNRPYNSRVETTNTSSSGD